MRRAAKEYARWNDMVDEATKPTNTNVPSYAQVVGVGEPRRRPTPTSR